MAAIAAGFNARAMKPGSDAMARKVGFLTISSNTSVCINCATAVSPSFTSLSVTWVA